MNTGEIIKKLRKERGLTQEQLGDIIGVQKSAIAKYESGRVENLKRHTIAKLAKYFGVTPSYILGIREDKEMYLSAGIDYISVPLYANICCGNGGFVDDNIVDYVPVPSQGLNMKKEHFCMFAQGDSMTPMIDEGDLLVFEKTSSPRENMIGAFCIGENEATCKKYVVSNGVVILKPLNTSYDPVPISVEDIKCIGCLRKIIRDVQQEM